MVPSCNNILNNWVKAKTYEDLLETVLNGNQSNLEDSQKNQQFDQIVKNFLEKSRESFTCSELNALKKLQQLIVLGAKKRSNNTAKVTLEKTIANVIKTFGLKSNQTCIEFSNIKTPSPITQYIFNHLKKKIKISNSDIHKFEEGEIHSFVKDLIGAIDLDKEMMRRFIREFFETADYAQRNIFFNLTCYYDRSNQDFFSYVVSSLQVNSPDISIQSEYLKDNHVKFILDYFKSLEVLNFSFCKNLTNESAQNLSHTNLSTLKKLVLSGNDWLTDEGATAITDSSNFPNLQDLQLQNCSNLTDQVPQCLSKNSKFKLEHLRISYCPKMTINAFEAIIASSMMPYLKSLEVSKFSTLTENLDLILSNPSKNYNLARFSFSSPEDLTNELFLKLTNSSFLDNLEHLDLVGCTQLNRESFISLSKSNHITNLKDLDLRGCSVSIEFVIELANNPNAKNLTNVSFTCEETKKDMLISLL